MGASQGGFLRLGVVLALAAGIVICALMAGYAGLALCFPAVLPGDEAWARGHLAAGAVQLVLGRAPEGCFAAGGPGMALQAAVWPATVTALALPALALLWEAFGWRLRLTLLRGRGGHAVLAGPSAETERIGRRAGVRRLWLVPGEEAGASAARPGLRGLWRHRVPLALIQTPAAARRIGLARAGLVVAAGADDLANFRLARLALEAGFAGRLVVRLEQRALRALASDVLREDAARTCARVLIAAPSVMQAREALQLALPGRFRDDGAGGVVHLAICGDGPQLDLLALMLARQGYGLEAAVPRLTILATGDVRDSPLAAVPGAGEVMDIRVVNGTDQDLDRLDADIAALVARAGRLTAVFCVSAVPGTAGLLARRWDAVYRDLGRVPPPVVVLDAGPPAGPAPDSVALPAPRPDLAEVDAVQTRLDARAQAIHAQYLDLMARVAPTNGQGAAPLPAQRPWPDLAERYREDNRAAADHMAYKLSLCGLVAGPVGKAGAFAPPMMLSAADIDVLAPVEHARWVAARRVAGWTHGPRDDTALTHPDLVPYAALDDIGREKDRDQVALLPHIALRGAEGLRREWPVRPGAEDLPLPDACRRVTEALARVGKAFPHHVPVLRLGPDPRDLALGRAVQAAGGLTELVVAEGDGPTPWSPGALSQRRGAHRLWITGDLASALGRAPALLTRQGGDHDLSPS